jgi:integrase
MRSKKRCVFRIGDYYLNYRADSPFLYIFCRKRGRQLTRSTGTADLEEAKLKLAEFVTLHGDHDRVPPQQARLRTVLWRYKVHRSDLLPSADQNAKAIGAWSDFYGNARITELTRLRQQQFVDHLKARDLATDTIRRYVEIGKAGLNWALDAEQITGFPKIHLPPKGEPLRWTPSQDEFVALWNAAEAPHLQMFLALAVNTLARPGALLELTRFSCDLNDGLIYLNPAGRQQTAKRRAIVPMTRSIRSWIEAAPAGPLVRYRGRAVKSLKRVWNETRDRAGLDHRFQPKVLRKMMAKVLRRAGVPKWDVKGMMGHSGGADVTEDHYAQFEPEFLHRVVDTIDAWAAGVDQVAARPITLAKTIACVSVAYQSPSSQSRRLPDLLVEPMGFEPTTSTVQTSRSSQLSYGPGATGASSDHGTVIRERIGGAEGSRTPDL